ncbi:hypothetical protein BDN72DRAFT_841092 [Pluteus cervinus]|uniref:Uncharacterized protein n=1 Tax=Pluteus cervinus TaxID=181527 RepID=A0ACD3ATP0_9AGAR|nr:hypothetical protein BDN72DRAFT_841092 [Pluteus cervinus]
MAQRIRSWLRPKDRRQHPGGTTFPPELWSEIISTYLTLKDIRALSECSNFLRNVSIPFLFQRFTMRPVMTYPDHWLGVVHRTLHRPPRSRIPNHIAQVIETVAILRNKNPLQKDGTEMDRIFELLMNLPKLRHLGCDRVLFTQDRLNKLVQLPLKRLELSNCTMPTAPITVKIAGTLEYVKLCFPAADPHRPRQGRTSLASVLLRDSPNLTSLHLADNVIFPMMILVRPPSVTILNVPAQYINDFNFVDVLMTCPSLKSIALRCTHYTGRSVTGNLIFPPGALPNLERYGGPFDIFPRFTDNRPTVKEVYLICPRVLGSPSTPIPSIPNSIESVIYNVQSPCPFFPLLHPSLESESLKRLTIISLEWSLEGLPQLLKSSNLAPLPNIRHLTLRAVYDVSQPNSRSRLEGILGDSLSALLEVYPNLEEAKIIPLPANWESEFSMLWRRSVSLTKWESSTYLRAIDTW